MRSRAGDELFFIYVSPRGDSRLGNVSSMTRFARLWSWFVVKNLDFIHRLLEGVTCRTRYILVSALQRKSSSLMIEKRRAPLVGVVARVALLCALAELICVRVFMAIAAFCGGFCEVHVSHSELEIRWLVAVCASNSAMRSEQWESRGVMIELR